MTTYLERLSPWCLVRHLPNMRRLTVGRFRRLNDAHEHMRILRQLVPEANYAIIFDPGLEQLNSPDEEN
jgi:hypothetical protein